MPLIKIPPLFRFRKDKGIKPRHLITTEVRFDAAHRISDCKNKHKRIHGHNYRVIVTIKSPKLNDLGVAINSRILRKLLKAHIDDKYDYKLILKSGDIENKVIGRILESGWVAWMNNNPTSENIARDIYKDIEPSLKSMDKDIKLVSVSVFETADNAATYKEIE